MRVIDRVPVALLTDAYELVVALVLALICIPVLFGQIQPTSIHATVGPAFRTGWAITLLLGCALTVLGLLLPRRPRLEWVGQLLVGVDLAVYGVAAVVNGGVTRVGVAAGIFCSLGLLGLWRALKISWQGYIRGRLARDAAHVLVQQAHRDAGTHA